LRLRPGSHVLIDQRDGEIRIRPSVLKPRDSLEATPDLDELVASITPENRHEEILTGPAVGREVF
jgi:antitoxin component of MazEF toxin-antitoxin module